MPKPFTVNGLPQSIAMDAWWLASDADDDASLTCEPPKRQKPRLGSPVRPPFGSAGLIFLVLFGDFLFWGYRPGFTLAVFALAVFGVSVLQSGHRSGLSKPTFLMCLSVLPVVEHVQVLSVGLLIAGSIVALAWVKVLRDGDASLIIAAATKLAAWVPYAGAVVLIGRISELRHSTRSGSMSANPRLHKLWQNWALPMGGALVLGGLLMAANPVLEQSIASLFRADVDLISLINRVILWCGLGLLIWPLINPPMPWAPTVLSVPSMRTNIGLNAGSVLRALVIFNLFLAVQSLLDISILLGGAALPNDMSYATYAHRGAYPLLVTAMLAGLFTFAAHPFLRENRLIKPLLSLWAGQNVLLTLSAALRLDLYVAEYGLTYLRIYAFIWMALVASGLIVVLWHVLRERSSLVLLLRLAALGLGTLYVCAFVNFASIIATHTLQRAANPTNEGTVDWSYVCGLGSTASKALVNGLEASPNIQPPSRLQSCFGKRHLTSNWRDVDFRLLRTNRYLPASVLR